MNNHNIPKCPDRAPLKSSGDYVNVRPARFKPAPDGDWDDDLDPEDRARMMGRDFMGPKWR